MQLLALIGLSLALARPALRGGKLTGDHVAIVIDTSASMGASAKTTDGKKTTRMALAIETAKNAIDNMEPGADAIIIEGARDARVVSPLDRDARRLKGSLAQLGVREVEGDLSAAVALAADRLRSLGGKRRVLLVTDGALASDAPLAASGMDLQVVTVGDPVDNSAIVRIDVRAGVDPVTKHDQVQVFGMLKNYGDSARRLRDGFGEGKRDPRRLASRARSAEREDRRRARVRARRRSTTARASRCRSRRATRSPSTTSRTAAFPQARKMPVAHATTGYSWIGARARCRSGLDLQKLTPQSLRP